MMKVHRAAQGEATLMQLLFEQQSEPTNPTCEPLRPVASQLAIAAPRNRTRNDQKRAPKTSNSLVAFGIDVDTVQDF